MIDISTLDLATLGITTAVQKHTYFIDPKNSMVYSHKTGVPTRLYGSLNMSNVRTYTLQPAAAYGRPIKLREDRLIKALAKYNTANTEPTPAVASTSHGWVIGKLQADCRVSFTDADGNLYTDESKVNAELERLAKASPGKKFVKARIEAMVEAAEVIWS